MEENVKSTRGRKPKTETNNTNTIDDKDLIIKQLQEQMAQMMTMINSQSQPQVVVQQNDNMSRTVRAVSTVPYTYVIPINNDGGKTGTVYKFNKFGDTQNIRFTDMPTILAKFSHCFENGDIILSNKKDYDDLGIGYIIDNISSIEEITKLTSLKRDEDIDIILSLNDEMREKIIYIIAQRVADGETFDFNKIKTLEDEGYDISEMADLISTKIK